jgi:hypothetical protein
LTCCYLQTKLRVHNSVSGLENVVYHSNFGKTF